LLEQKDTLQKLIAKPKVKLGPMISSGLTDEKTGGLCNHLGKVLIGRSQGIESREYALAGDFTFENF
jgi:hypothetical protein